VGCGVDAAGYRPSNRRGRSLNRSADVDGAWRRATESLDAATLAHAPEWFSVIRSAYGHEPLYLSATDEHGEPGLLPAFVVRRPLFGTVVTSMPFLDTGGPCTNSTAMSTLLVERLIDRARQAGARCVELRCTRRLPIAVRPMEHKVNLTLPLPSDPDVVWRALDGSGRNQIRKAERSGLAVLSGDGSQLAAFYDVFAARMRDLGSPVHALPFMRAAVAAFGSHARVILVQKGRTVVGGLVALAFKDRLAVPWAACLKEYFSLCPNMLLYWETLRFACNQGFRQFDFGRSTRGGGTYRFKRQWGAREEPLFWYTIPVRSEVGPSPEPTDADHHPLAASMWRRLPLSVTRRLGPSIRRYLTQ
jgi:FemAB-related protein (PEP-CTERM system-associated)